MWKRALDRCKIEARMTMETLFSGLRKSRISATNVLTIFAQRYHMQPISVPTWNFVRKLYDYVNSIRDWNSRPWNNTICYWRNTKNLSKSTATVRFDCEVDRFFIVNLIFMLTGSWTSSNFSTSELYAALWPKFRLYGIVFVICFEWTETVDVAPLFRHVSVFVEVDILF